MTPGEFKPWQGGDPIFLIPNDLNAMLEYAEGFGFSDIDIQTDWPVFITIHGIRKKLFERKLLDHEVDHIVNCIYDASNGAGHVKKGTPIDKDYEVRAKGSRTKRYRYRTNHTAVVVNNKVGIQVTIRSIPVDPPTLEACGVPMSMFNMTLKRQGLVLITGKTGSGKSTTLAAIFRKILEEEGEGRKIVTLESPIEFVYDNVDCKNNMISQTSVPYGVKTFAKGIEANLRRAPTIGLVGEIRDEETILASLEFCITGHLVYATMHTNGVSSTIDRILKWFPSEAQTRVMTNLCYSLRCVISQTLEKTVDGKRVALREVLEFTPEIRDFLLECDDGNIFRRVETALNRWGHPMERDARKYLEESVITQDAYDSIIGEYGNGYNDGESPPPLNVLADSVIEFETTGEAINKDIADDELVETKEAVSDTSTIEVEGGVENDIELHLDGNSADKDIDTNEDSDASSENSAEDIALEEVVANHLIFHDTENEDGATIESEVEAVESDEDIAGLASESNGDNGNIDFSDLESFVNKLASEDEEK